MGVVFRFVPELAPLHHLGIATHAPFVFPGLRSGPAAKRRNLGLVNCSALSRQSGFVPGAAASSGGAGGGGSGGGGAGGFGGAQAAGADDPSGPGRKAKPIPQVLLS